MDMVFCILLTAAGAWCFVGAAFNLAIVMDQRKARRFVHMLGLTGARILYIVIGLSMMGVGAAWIVILLIRRG